jgi:hypothetical protein
LVIFAKLFGELRTKRRGAAALSGSFGNLPWKRRAATLGLAIALLGRLEIR